MLKKMRIMFVCHGNICRSPMAEFILKDVVHKAGRDDEFEIASSATSREEIGNTVYPPAKTELAKHGISCKGKYAVQLTKADYDRYDRIICMESYNIRNAMRILGDDPESKVFRLLPDRDVADPWYSGDFETAYNDIYEGCKMILEVPFR